MKAEGHAFLRRDAGRSVGSILLYQARVSLQNLKDPEWKWVTGDIDGPTPSCRLVQFFFIDQAVSKFTAFTLCVCIFVRRMYLWL